MNPSEAIEAGRLILEPVLSLHGFSFERRSAGESSGGTFASAAFVRGEWTLEFHFRDSLGMVSYHMGEAMVTHERYMEAVLGKRGLARYPGFSSDPLDAFRDVASDLQTHGQAFLTASQSAFRTIVERAASMPRPKGLAGVP